MDIFKPIQLLSDLITYNIFDIQNGSYLGNAVNFFIYDLIKIGILLVIINYIMAITRYYFPVEKVKDILTKRKWYGLQYLMAALLGVITPFCSYCQKAVVDCAPFDPWPQELKLLGGDHLDITIDFNVYLYER